MESRQDLVLVTGVTGKQGGAVAREMVAKGVRVRGMTRHPESDAAGAMQRLGVGIPHFENKWRIEQSAFGADLAMMLEWFDGTGYDADIAALSRESGISPTRFKEWAAHAPWKVPVAAS